MKKLLIALAAVLITASSYGQGQVWFANRVTGVLDAPVTIQGTQTGPGPSFVAQLFLQGQGGALTALGTPVAFNNPGANPIAIQYWPGSTVDTTGVNASTPATFVIRAWNKAAASFDAAKTANIGYGESAAFTVTTGGGTLPPANLTTLTAFTVTPIPEPTVIALGVLGAAAFMLRRRK